jgi:uridine kinase
MKAVSERDVGGIEAAVNSALPLKRNYIIGISGIDGAGKSTLARDLCARFRDQAVPHYLVDIDSFLRPRKVRNANLDQAVGYYEETFDFEKIFDQLLKPLRDQREFSKTFDLIDWPGDEYKEKRFDIDGPALVVVEGVFLFRRAYADLFDLRVWLDISFEGSLSRVQARHRDRQYYSSPDAITDRYQNRFYPGQRIHFDRDDPKSAAHLVIPVSERDDTG